MGLIEKYHHSEEGYNPFLIRDNWQIAQLNYLPGHGIDDIRNMETHRETDEVFVLIAGNAVLIAMNTNQPISFEFIRMETGVVYNIPRGVWHNIAMDKEAQIIITENANTHLNDVEYYDLSEVQREYINTQISAFSQGEKF